MFEYYWLTPFQSNDEAKIYFFYIPFSKLSDNFLKYGSLFTID